LPIFFYNIILVLYRAGIGITSFWNVKARKWIEGRKNIFESIQLAIRPVPGSKNSEIVWIHCSSLGEFEQGRPVMEKIKTKFPNYRLLVTFFSPSGYEIKKNHEGADYVFYLPMDSKKNAQKFLDLVNPALIIFIKYDYWYYYLSEIKKRNINCLLISAVFRKDQAFFKWYGSLQRMMLHCFTAIFVQNDESLELLKRINITNCSVSGDTRFDRVIEIAKNFEPLPPIEKFINNSKCIVAGSTWKEDEESLAKVLYEADDPGVKLIIAPHEVTEGHLKELKYLFPQSFFFSELINDSRLMTAILIIDNIGMLSRLYKYGDITYVGGGFSRDGVHNVLEAAVYGKPVIFGENYKKYNEAVDLIESGCAKSFSDCDELYQSLITLLIDDDDYKKKCAAAEKYIFKNAGATKRVLKYIQENRLLTS